MLLHQVQSLARGRSRMKGSKITGSVRARTPYKLQSRPLCLLVQTKAQVLFVVAQLDVQSRSVLLDQIVFKDDCFFFSLGDDRGQIADQSRQRGNKSAIVRAAG